MERRLLALERRAPTGIGVSSYIGGQQEIRVMQPGFATTLTSTFDPTYGYNWAQLVADVSIPGITTQFVPLTGNRAFTPDNNKTLPVGTRGWLEPDPQAASWVFLADVGCYVSNVCPQFSSGIVIGMVVEKTCPDGSVTCYLNPANCCPVPLPPPPPPPPPILCPASCGTTAIGPTLYAKYLSRTTNCNSIGNCPPSPSHSRTSGHRR